jgi:valyl-tRNA synthetase
MKEIPKAYNPSDYEDDIYQKWEQSGYFNPDNLKLKKGADYFSLCMPPPNVTGILHLGHALENAIMDTTVRYQRMRGKKAVLIPGTDHAAVATQAKVEKDLIKSGIKDPRQELGREKLLEIIRDYSEKSKATILSQIRKMGTSADWSRLAYTFDNERSKAVNQVFSKMYKDGLIYRGYRVVNWSVKGQSTCSDDELVYIERDAKFYTFKYSKNFPITISTTRPETKLGDTAVAVNPKDERYKKYIGQEIVVEKFGGSVDLRIKVIADENIDPSFGTGAVGITPAHSMIDYEMYQKNGGIGFVQVIDKDDLMTFNAGGEYNGLSIETAREKVVQWLRQNNLLIKEEEIKQNVGTSDRFGDVVEVLPMTQWFVNVNKKIPSKNKSLKELMFEAVKVGHNSDSKQKIRINPERFEKVYFNWINNLRDWCISRQIWWGHRIPVWYDLAVDEYEKYKNSPDKFGDFLNLVFPQRLAIGSEKPSAEGHWLQDPDTLDTWFSSGLWTFSTLGWPRSAKAMRGRPGPENDLANFHPTTWMQTAYENLFFWIARMILMSTYAVDEIPFKDVYIHGIVRDKEGRKFSKSLGNGIDPIEVINKYGADALRLSLLSSVAPGNDMRFYEEKVEGARNFVNKLWNISRYILTKRESSANFALINANKLKIKTLADKWILEKFSQVTKEVTNDLENFNFSQAGEKLRDFTWSDFADWYLEIAKVEGNKDEILLYILENLLILWHPFIPFVTEKIWESFDSNLLMIEEWPEMKKENRKQKTEKSIDKDIKLIQNIIVAIRNLRAEYKIEPAKKLNVVISAGAKTKLLEENVAIIKGLRTGIGELKIEKKIAKPKGWVELDAGVSIYIDLAGAVDIVKEKERIGKEIGETEKYVKSLADKLDNKEFVSKAPENIVSQEKEKLKQQAEKLANLEKQIKILE